MQVVGDFPEHEAREFFMMEVQRQQQLRAGAPLTHVLPVEDWAKVYEVRAATPLCLGWRSGAGGCVGASRTVIAMACGAQLQATSTWCALLVAALCREAKCLGFGRRPAAIWAFRGCVSS